MEKQARPVFRSHASSHLDNAGRHAAPNRICQHCVDALGSSPVAPRAEHAHSASVSPFDTCSFPAANASTMDTARRTGDWDQKSPVHTHIHTRLLPGNLNNPIESL